MQTVRALLVLLPLAGLLAADAAASQGLRGRVSPEMIHRNLDRDGDGFLTKDELQGRERLLAGFDYLDTNADGALSLEEFATALERAQGAGRGGDRRRGAPPRPMPPAPAPEPAPAPMPSATPESATPVALPEARYGVQTRDVMLQGDDRSLPARVSFPLGNGPFPVVLFSPYLGGLDDAYTPMAEFLAGQGYVVLQLAHADSVGDMGTGAGQAALAAWRERPADLRFALDNLRALERAERRLEGKLDTDAIAVGGHLVGAFAASFLAGARTVEGDSYEDGRVDAALLLAPQGRSSLMDEDAWRDIDVPMMVITGTELPSRRTGNPAEWRTEPFVYSEGPDKYLVYVQGMDGRFGGLFDDGRRGAGYQGVVNAALESYVLAASLAFLDAHLRADTAARRDLAMERLERDSGGVAQVRVKAGAAGGDPALAGDYEPLRGMYPVGEERFDLYDASRRRTLPVRVFAPDVAPSGGGWPVVVFSHGLGESRDAYTYLGEALAASGYAVVFMTHEGSDSSSVRRGLGSLDTVSNAGEKAADARFLIDQIVADAIDSRLLAGRLDAARLVAAGQCAGSSIAAGLAGLRAVLPGNEPFAPRDSRVDAVVLLGPQVPIELAQPSQAGTNEGLDMLKADSWEGIDLPLLVVAGDRDFMWYDAVRRDPRIRLVAYDTAASDEKYLVDLAGGGHHAFTDSRPWYPAGPRVPGHHEDIASAVVAFLDAYVGGEVAALAWLQSEALEQRAGNRVRQAFESDRLPDNVLPFPGGGGRVDRGAGSSPDAGADAWDGRDWYKAERGPYDIEVVERLILEDAARGKELQVRVTYPARTDERHPVIVFVHGAWASNTYYQPLVEHWASHGYVLLQANHRDSTALGTRVRDTSVFRDWQERPNDVHFLFDSLDEVARRVPDLAGRLDRERMGVGGHSYGAHTAQLVAGTSIIDFPSSRVVNLADPRVDAALLMSAQGRNEQFDENAWDTLTLPVMVMTGTMDPGRSGEGVDWRLDPFIFAASDEKHLLFIEGAYHDFGGATGGTLPGQPSHDDPDMVRFTRSASTAFWDAYLRGSDAARAFLSSGVMERLSDGEAVLTQSEAEARRIAEANSTPVRRRRRR